MQSVFSVTASRIAAVGKEESRGYVGRQTAGDRTMYTRFCRPPPITPCKVGQARPRRQESV